MDRAFQLGLAGRLADCDLRLAPGLVVGLPGDVSGVVGQLYRRAQMVALVVVDVLQRGLWIAGVAQAGFVLAVVQRIAVQVVTAFVIRIFGYKLFSLI